MGTEAFFGYTNGTVIENNLDETRKESVIHHEMVHHRLYTLTSLGQFVLMMEKNEMFFPQAKILKEVLFSHMNRFQESVAVNIENLNVLISDGREKYDIAVENLSIRNRKYYNYFRKLGCVNRNVETEEDAEDYIVIIQAIAEVAMNINLNDIPFEEMTNEKDFERFISKGKNNIKYLPNRRFDILFDYFFRDINIEYDDLECVIQGGIASEHLGDPEYIHTVAFEKAVNVYKKSKSADRFIERIKSVCIKPYTDEDGDLKYLNITPTNIAKNRYRKLIGTKSIEKFCEFISEKKATEVMVMHRLGGFEDFSLVCMDYMEGKEKKRICIALEGEDKFLELINNIKCTIIFDKLKIIKNLGKSLRIHIHNLPIYIFIDVPLIGLIEEINDYFRGAKYGFWEEEGYTVWIVNKRSQILIADIVSEAKDVIVKRFDSMTYTENLSDIVDYDEFKRIHKYCLNSLIMNHKELEPEGTI